MVWDALLGWPGSTAQSTIYVAMSECTAMEPPILKGRGEGTRLPPWKAGFSQHSCAGKKIESGPVT
jgi:hypothetical protein